MITDYYHVLSMITVTFLIFHQYQVRISQINYRVCSCEITALTHYVLIVWLATKWFKFNTANTNKYRFTYLTPSYSIETHNPPITSIQTTISRSLNQSKPHNYNQILTHQTNFISIHEIESQSRSATGDNVWTGCDTRHATATMSCVPIARLDRIAAHAPSSGLDWTVKLKAIYSCA